MATLEKAMELGSLVQWLDGEPEVAAYRNHLQVLRGLVVRDQDLAGYLDRPSRIGGEFFVDALVQLKGNVCRVMTGRESVWIGSGGSAVPLATSLEAGVGRGAFMSELTWGTGPITLSITLPEALLRRNDEERVWIMDLSSERIRRQVPAVVGPWVG
jgi:hypothetical protein